MSKHLFERIKVFFRTSAIVFCSSVSCVQLTHDKVGIYLQGWQCRRTVGEVCWFVTWSPCFFKSISRIDLSPILRGFVTCPRSENSHEYPWIFHDLKLTSTAALEPGDLEIPRARCFFRQGWSTYSEWRRWAEKNSHNFTLPISVFAWLYSVCPPNKILRDI